MEKLSREEVIILDSLKSTGTVERLSEIIKMQEGVLSKILGKLEVMGLAKRIKSGKDDDIDFWFTTEEGESCIRNNYLRNEFGDMIDNDDVRNIAERVARLPDELIDDLYFRCGFIYTNHTMKALSKAELEGIRKDSMFIEGLLLETPIDEVLKNLEDIEKGR